MSNRLFRKLLQIGHGGMECCYHIDIGGYVSHNAQLHSLPGLGQQNANSRVLLTSTASLGLSITYAISSILDIWKTIFDWNAHQKNVEKWSSPITTHSLFPVSGMDSAWRYALKASFPTQDDESVTDVSSRCNHWILLRFMSEDYLF